MTADHDHDHDDVHEAAAHVHSHSLANISLGKWASRIVVGLLAVIGVAVLAGLIVPRIMDRPEEARRTKAAIQIQSIEQALKLYKLDNGQYPTTEQGLNALVEAPAVGVLAKKWRTGGYLEKGRVPKDPWDNDFVYISPGLHGDFDLISYGPDNQSGGEGNDADLNNWELQ